MKNKEKFYKELVRRYNSGIATDKEIVLFLALLKSGDLDNAVEDHMNELLGIKKTVFRTLTRIKFVQYAAAILIVCLIGWQLNTLWKEKNQKTEMAYLATRGPALNKANLRVVNGAGILLDASINGLLITDEGIKNEGGQLVHQGNNEYYEIEVPKGGTYQLTLSDGSKVWMNSGSSLRFPQWFNPGMRKVELRGEAFFEIEKKTAQNGQSIPFIVHTEKQDVEVLGTSFNVKAYEDDKCEYATLFTGKVKITANKKEEILKPGLATIIDKEGKLEVYKADLEAVMGWRSGAFVFNETPIDDILRQLGRWYNVDMIFVGDADFTFNGYFQRNITLGEALETLMISGELQYKYQDNKIIVEQKNNRPM